MQMRYNVVAEYVLTVQLQQVRERPTAPASSKQARLAQIHWSTTEDFENVLQ